jgi:predicted NUDIX family phosphoesterase
MKEFMETQKICPVKVAQQDEFILVVQRDQVFARGSWQGLLTECVDYYRELVASKAEYRSRLAMENDAAYKQIIPYMIFEYNDSYFLMERKSTASEQRLKSKLSLGIGGHVRQEDMGGGSLFDWASREFHEEVRYEGALSIETLGVLNDDNDSVGQVHLGFVLLLRGTTPDISIRSEHKEGKLVHRKDMDHYLERMESWSQIVWYYIRAFK